MWCVVATGVTESGAKTIEDVKLPPASLAPQCSSIDGEHAISLQATTHYGMVEKYPQTLFKPPGRKAYQSFDCSGAKSTIYYYEYASKEDLDHALGFTKGLIWGEGGRSSMHPEFILPIENVLVVISSRDAEFFVYDFFYGIPGEVGRAYGEAMEPYGEKNYAKAEKLFRALTHTAPDLVLGHLYLGQSLFFQAKYHEAIPEYERGRDLAVKNGGVAQLNERVLSDQLGMSYALDGRLPDAKAVFETAIKRDPEYPMSYYNLACAFAELGNLDDALTNLKLGYARKDHMLPGETYPDPRTDDSFKKYLANEKFKAAMKELGY
jgi:tetratricopeptide (TPR) repeat protein